METDVVVVVASVVCLVDTETMVLLVGLRVCQSPSCLVLLVFFVFVCVFVFLWSGEGWCVLTVLGQGCSFCGRKTQRQHNVEFCGSIHGLTFA